MMGAWRRLHTRAPGGRLLIVSTTGVVLERPRVLILAVRVPDEIWTVGLRRRLRRGMFRRLSSVTTPSARLLRFEGEAQKLLPRNFAGAYIANCSKSVAAGPPSRCAKSSCKKNSVSPLTGSTNTAFFCSSYSKAAAFLGSGHEFRSAAASLQTTRRS